MDDTIKSILLQMPAIAILLYAVKVLYLDAKADRIQAGIERQQMLDKIDILTDALERQTVSLARVERACGADMLPPVKS